MIDRKKRAFGGWWMWVLALIVITSAVGFGMRFLGIAGERVIFENSYQKAAADNDRRATLEAELVAVNARLRSSSLTDAERDDLEAQRAGLQFQLNRKD